MSTTLKPGDAAPAFKGTVTDGSTVSLKDFKGKKSLVLYFYPMDNTPGCTREARCFRDAAERFEEKGAAILGVSTQSVESHARFSTNNELPFPLLSDADKKVASSYGVLKSNGKTAERATFLIDKKGKVRKVWPKVSITGHVDEILSAIDELGL
jgi:peroxiredoxin Q/BCP